MVHFYTKLGFSSPLSFPLSNVLFPGAPCSISDLISLIECACVPTLPDCLVCSEDSLAYCLSVCADFNHLCFFIKSFLPGAASCLLLHHVHTCCLLSTPLCSTCPSRLRLLTVQCLQETVSQRIKLTFCNRCFSLATGLLTFEVLEDISP